MNVSREMVLALIPVIVLNYGLAAYCIIDMVKRGRPRYLPKAAWIPIVLFVQIFGSVAYLLLGRNHDTA
ncbi:MAG: PLDc_N domain-containing protein [Spirochaetales bacterium]|nr:PLDc_N domain-containing protein [Spirochaetales bacterium]